MSLQSATKLVRLVAANLAPSPLFRLLAAAGVTFASFMFFGSLPLWPYIVFLLVGWDADVAQFGICIGITAMCLFFLG